MSGFFAGPGAVTSSGITDATTIGKSLLTAANAAAERTALGLAAVAASGSATDLTAGTLPAGQFPALTGDVTTSAGALASTLATAQTAAHTWSAAQTFTATPVVTVSPGSGTGVDFSGCTVSVANGANAALPLASGLVIINDTTNGQMGAYLSGSATPVLLGGGTEFVAATTSPTSGKSSFAYDGASNMGIYNNTGGTVVYAVVFLKTRNTI